MTLSKYKKVIKIFIVIFAMFFIIPKANAECTYIEKARLNEIAANIKTNYEVIEETVNKEFLDPDTQEVGTYERIKTSFKISIYNLTDELYIIQNNNIDRENKYIFFEDTTDGIYEFINEDSENIIKYTFNVYSNTESCSADILKSYNFIKPKINMYSQYGICHGLEDVPYCQKYITEEINVSEAALNEKVSEYLKEDKPIKEIEKEGIKEFIKENYIYIIVGVVILAGTLTGTIIFVKKRRAI